MLVVFMKVARILGVAVGWFLPMLAGNLFAQTFEGRQLVKAELVADTSAVVPGKPFTLGLLLHMAPHWHTYWKYSGDAGLPTEIHWHLPPGWKIGEIQWPIPLKTTDPGDIQTYGYQDEVMLMQEITPPKTVDTSAVTLSADASWLVCEKICIPGGATLRIDLPTATTSEPANAALFAHYRRLLPQDWPAGSAAKASWSRTGSELHLHLARASLSNRPSVDFYPLPPDRAVIGHPEIVSRNKNEIVFRIPLESSSKHLMSMQGLVVFGQHPNADDRTAWRLGENATPATRSTVSPSAPATVAAPASSHGLLAFLFFGFVGGFILNLMPCVLPVISLKIFGFVKQAGQSRRRILRSGLAFTAGIFAWFVALALLLMSLKAAGREVTWGGFQFTNAYFVLALAVVVLVFALDLFGVFEISLPQSVMRNLLSTTERKDDVGSFFQGVFATVLATPCTAPFLGAALGFAFAQSPIVILAMFLAIALGMSAPYLVLSAQPAWLRFLPKPGPWMIHVKQFMGFLLLATLLFLLYVLGAQRGLGGMIWASCFLLIVAVICWMAGAFFGPLSSPVRRQVSLMLMLVLLIGGGAYFIGDKFRSAKIEPAGARMAGDWQPFTPERLQSELARGHSVFVDFTAAWCLTCKFNEKTVLESAPVQEAFQRRGIVKLRADWTNGDPVITKLLKQFGRPGVPLYVLYPGKSGEPIVFPELLTQSIVLDKLETISPTVASE
jgi:thiol:disulfide interchange protein/DsbC/DsbD-like thiol-disulfide interchange protein